MVKLPAFLRLNDARREKNELFASLGSVEVEILDKVLGGGTCYGSDPAKEKTGRIVLGSSGSRGQDSKVFDGQATLNTMVRAGWLRYAKMPAGGGYFWATASSERLWRVLGRPVRD